MKGKHRYQDPKAYAEGWERVFGTPGQTRYDSLASEYDVDPMQKIPLTPDSPAEENPAE